MDMSEIFSPLEAYVLSGQEFGEEPIIFGVYSNMESAINDIEDYESDPENYSCCECDFQIDPNIPMEDQISFEMFYTKRCPICGGELCYDPVYNTILIEKYKIMDLLNGNKYRKRKERWENRELIYECSFNDKTNKIEEKFSMTREKRYRKPNTKIMI